MVVSNPKIYILDAGHPQHGSTGVGILTFETASAMSQLVSLHHLLSDRVILKLRSHTMRSQGVAYLNSTDQSLLLKQSCAELITDLDRAADVISRLGRRCHGPLSVDFNRVYTDLKAGSLDPTRLGINLGVKTLDKRMKKLEKLTLVSSKLYKEMELLSELEAAEKKKQDKLGVVDVKSQAQKVQKLKKESLWNQSLHKSINLMAASCYSIFARICAVFGPFVPGLPSVAISKEHSRLFFATSYLKTRIHPKSGPLERRAEAKESTFRNSCPIISGKDERKATDWRKVLEPKGDTVGGAGLAMRYADVIVLAEKMMMGGGEGTEREELWEMLPEEVLRAVKGKLRRCWRERGEADAGLADGWKDAMWRILGWLGPIAHDTVQWGVERNMDRRGRFERRGTVYMFQTLHFSDRAKTEAAVTEVLVGLSLVTWYDQRCPSESFG